MLLVSEREVEELLDLDDLIDALAGAMADLSSVAPPFPTASRRAWMNGRACWRRCRAMRPPPVPWRASWSRSFPITPTPAYQHTRR
jgi:hypothetical protein